MSSSRSLLSKWCFEYMAPVVVTTSSAEVENTCLKNGLLFHELLSAFGHLDSIHASVRSANQSIHLNDAHVRFERITEAQAKSSGCMEEALRLNFKEFDMRKLPVDFDELKSTPPSGWSHEIEQRIIRSTSFSEFEMISQPLCIMTVVSTADVDPVACMQELCSPHHSPTGFKSGQYDPEVQRLYMILHDNSAGLSVDTALLLRQMKSKFSPTRTKLLCINSLPDDGQNFQQPDIWTRWKIPMYFPQHAPMLEPSVDRPLNPSTGEPSIGTRLSMEDFMSLRNFCIEIYQQDLLPQVERRIGILTRIVNDTKKGVKNVLKNFWRKPREETQEKGSVRYRYDRVESQILLLSDTAFSLKDYDFAMTHYKLVRDDFKADKSVLHVVHCSVMIAACQFLMDPMSNRGRDLIGHLEAVKECLPYILDSGHFIARYAVLLSELYTAVPGCRYPLEAAAVLLQASAAVSRLSLLSALLSERAALFCIQAGQFRKYSFHHVLAGNKFYAVGNRAMRHAMVCYACVLLLHESGNWTGVKSKLYRILADELKSAGESGSRRAVLFMLRVVNFLTQDSGTLNPLALADSVSVLYELLEGKYLGDVEIMKEWKLLKTRQILLGAIPVSDRASKNDPEDAVNLKKTMDLMKIESSDALVDSTDSSEAAVRTVAVVHDIPVPTIVLPTVCFLEPVNGSALTRPFEKIASDEEERVRSFSTMEQDWVKSYLAGCSKLSFVETWVKMEETLASSMSSRKIFLARKNLIVPLGESVVLRAELSNRFPVELLMNKLQLVLSDNSVFDVESADVALQGCENRVITLTATPGRIGIFQVIGATWYLSNSLQISQPLERLGPKLQKTLSQRINGIRGEDDSLSFEVVPEHPNLRVEISGIKNEIIQGELTRISLSLLNEGAVAAGNIVVKLSLPCIIFEEEGIRDFIGGNSSGWDPCDTGKAFPALSGSSTIVRLPDECVIPPGTELKFYGWMKMDTTGRHNLSVTASYYAVRLSGVLEPLRPSLIRTSTSTFKIAVKPSVSFKVACHTSLGKEEKMIQLEMSSFLSTSTQASDASASDKSLIGNALTSKWDWELTDNDVRVECIWILGGAKTCEKVASVAYAIDDTSSNIIDARCARTMNSPRLGAGETYCTGIAVEVIRQNEAGVSHIGGDGNIESKNLFWDANSQPEVVQEWKKVMDRFLCLSDANFRFQSALEIAREKFRQEAESLADAQPRSIASVRKGNQENKSCGAATVESVAAEFSPLTNTDVQGISDQGVQAGEVIIAIGWVAICGGLLKRGLHITDALPVLDAVASRPSVIASDFLQVQLQHDHKGTMTLPKGTNVIISVRLILSSTASRDLSVDVEAVDTFLLKRGNNTSTNQISGSGGQQALGGSAAFTGNDLFSPNVPVKGIRWEGKLRHKKLLLPAFGKTTLIFMAAISRPGVYDLKNFNITVAFPGTSGTTEATKVLSGQSLVCILDNEP